MRVPVPPTFSDHRMQDADEHWTCTQVSSRIAPQFTSRHSSHPRSHLFACCLEVEETEQGMSTWSKSSVTTPSRSMHSSSSTSVILAGENESEEEGYYGHREVGRNESHQTSAAQGTSDPVGEQGYLTHNAFTSSRSPNHPIK